MSGHVLISSESYSGSIFTMNQCPSSTPRVLMDSASEKIFLLVMSNRVKCDPDSVSTQIQNIYDMERMSTHNMYTLNLFLYVTL